MVDPSTAAQGGPLTGQALTLAQPLTNTTTINDALRLETFDLPSPTPTQVLVQFLAAPINPLDIHVLRGVYPVKPRHTVRDAPIPGFDGVARVLRIGSAVEELQEGNLVIPRSYGLGTWRTHAVLEARDLVRIKRGANVLFAAMLKTVVLPAYLLVEDMAALEQGDWVVQNAGTSAIAQAVVQFGRLKGVKSVSVVRDRPGGTADLAGLADVVVQESDFDPAEIAKGRNVKLALDSVWGNSARRIASALGSGGVFVNYGLLSGGGPESGFQITMRDIFFKGTEFRGFRTSAQAAKKGEDELEELFGWFLDLFDAKQLRLPKLQEVRWNAQEEQRLVEAVGSVVDMKVNNVKPVFVFE